MPDPTHYLIEVAPPTLVNANLILSVFANLKLTHFLLIAQQKCPV